MNAAHQSKPRIGLIGYGAIGRAIVAQLRAEGASDQIAAVLVRRAPEEQGLPLCLDLDAFLAHRPDVVIEAAGHEAVAAHGEAVLRAGRKLVICSVGALADTPLLEALRRAAGQGGGAVIIPAGAIAGLDGLSAARLAGLDSVTYTSYKPPHAWVGTQAEQLLALDSVTDDAVFFEGSAREAATHYPRNANVSAAIALAGIGFERTRVRLVASRRWNDPMGLIEAEGEFGTFRFEILAHAFPENPKTSMLTAYSLLQCARLGGGISLEAL